MKHFMFTTCLFALLAGSATSAQAQVLKTQEGGILVIPGSLTNSGKGMLAVASYNEDKAKGMKKESGYYDDELDEVHITIYDTKMNKQTEFDFTLPTVKYTCWRERAVTNYKLNDIFVLRDENKYTIADGVNITTTKQLLAWMQENHGWNTYEIFKDANGVEYVINNYYDDAFFEYYNYGKAIVRRFYMVENNTVYEVYRYFEVNYDIIYNLDMSSLNWQKVGDTWTEHAEYDVADCYMYDLDEGDGAYDRENFIISQNLFNNDDKWEFALIPDNIAVQEMWGIQFNENGYYYVERTKTSGDGDDCDLVIVNQDGTILNKINFDGNIDDDFDVIRMDGKTYLLVTIEDEDYDDYSCLYLYDTLGNGVKKVASGKLKVTPAIVNRGQGVNVELDAKAKNSSVTVTSVDGKTLLVQPVNDHKEMRIDTSRLTKGVYNVTVSEQGKVRKTERFIVK